MAKRRRSPFRKMLYKSLTTLCFWGAVITPAQAWWETGHMTVAQIAYEELSPKARLEAERLIELLNAAEPDSTRRHFVPASIWMDEVKARGLRTFDQWHYINIPYNPEGLGEVEDAKEVNVVTMLETLSKTLASDKAGDFEKAFALRMILHLAGDIHQPFHAVGKVSHAHPHGDLGGNRTLVQAPGVKNIHAFWDSTAGLLEEVSTDQWQSKVPGYAQRLKKDFPKLQYAQTLNTSPEQWAEESFKLALKYGYTTLPPEGLIDERYRREAQRVIAERLALGGYRLGYLLNTALQ